MRTSHLRAQDAYIREQVEMGELIVEHVSSQYQLADALTKQMSSNKYWANIKSLLHKRGYQDDKNGKHLRDN